MKNDIRNSHPQRKLAFEERIAVAHARVKQVWWDRGRLAWLPWLVAAAVLFGAAKNVFQWVHG